MGIIISRVNFSNFRHQCVDYAACSTFRNFFLIIKIVCLHRKKRGVSSTPFCCHTCGVHAHLQIKCGNHTKLCSVHAHFMRLVWLAHHILSTYTLYPVGVISTQNIECSLKVYTCNTCSVQTQVTSTPSTYGVHAHFR